MKTCGFERLLITRKQANFENDSLELCTGAEVQHNYL